MDNVVFPTALDAREDGRIDVARLQVPDELDRL
jgi:hypothetical protein